MENQKKQYTIDEVIQITIANLQGLVFPVMLSEEYGVPIKKSIENLYIVQQMLDQERQKKVQKTEAETTDEQKEGEGQWAES